jgi:4-hydroxybenzoate polyprenyltransferase
MRAIFSGLRWVRLGYYLSMFFLGISITRSGLIQNIADNLSCFILTIIPIVLAWLGAIMLNDVEDYEIDIITNKDRLLVKNIFSKSQFRNLSLWLFASACIFASAVNWTTLFFTGLLVASSCIYSLPPLRLRGIPVFSKSLIALNSLLLVMLGWLFAGKELLRFPAVITWYFMVFVTLATNLIDIKDYAGDKQAGIKTLPVILGIERAKLVNGLFILSAYSMLGLVFLDKYILVGGTGLGLLQLFLITRRIFREKLLLLINFCGIAALLVYLNSPLWLK